ncbi:hypothetical protein OCU04_010488 [Sclerotinia nivalis]|uniref:Uncharacterized protein n=1 Tax=Sclerotinia nivalis TaxID=352851 RepID=A0A9X0DGR1_9HELO|nr:hypothetical protein OCU04_010488 [Sclerotinia nivalis]
MSLSTHALDRENEDATLISSLISQLGTKSTTHHTVNAQTTIINLQGRHVRVRTSQRVEKATSFRADYTNSAFPPINELLTGSDDKIKPPIHHQANAELIPSNHEMSDKALDKFERFLSLKPKIRERIYNHYMDSRIRQCFCPECAPRPLSTEATVIFNILGTNEMVIDAPQSYCVPLVLSLLLANKEIYNELRPLFYNQLTALLALKGPFETYIPPLHTTRAIRLFPAFRNFVTKWAIELSVDTFLPKGVDTQSDWCIKTLTKEVYRISTFLEHCKVLNHLTVIIKVKHFSHTWFETGGNGQFEFKWLHPFLEFALDSENAVKIRVEMHLPHMESWWKKEYQAMWVEGWNAGLVKERMGVHELFFRDAESGIDFVL